MFCFFTRRALSGTANSAIQASKAQSSRPATYFRILQRENSSAECDAPENLIAPSRTFGEGHRPSAPCNCGVGVSKRWKLHDKIFAYICAAGTSKYAYVVQPFKETLFEDLPKTRSQKILEVGVGPGTNFAYYNARIPDAQIFGLDPNPEMKSYFEKKAEKYQFKDAEFVEAYGDGMPFPDKFFDCIVATHVLCSVPDVSKTLAEIHRVLKPQGRFIFFEHVIGPPRSFVRAVQTVLHPFQKRISGGCHIKRDILADIRSSSFQNIQAREFMVPKAGFCGPHISGFAVV